MLITSFNTSRKKKGEFWSTAVYQPSGFNYPKAEWMDIRHNGVWTRPRNFVDKADPLQAYFDYLWWLYGCRIDEAREWISKASPDAILCCWCPFDRAAQRQLTEWGSFVCHTAVVGKFLEWLDVSVEYDDVRTRLMKKAVITLGESKDSSLLHVR